MVPGQGDLHRVEAQVLAPQVNLVVREGVVVTRVLGSSVVGKEKKGLPHVLVE